MNFHDVFAVDFEAGRLFWKKPPKNHAEKVGQEAGYICKGKGKNKNYWQVRAFGKTFKRSRVIFHMAHGRWPEPLVDHINGNSMDDRLSNLREASYAENTMSSKDKPRKYDLPRGIYYHTGGRFMARIQIDGKTRSLGCYATVDEAMAVYLAKRKEVYGEFA